MRRTLVVAVGLVLVLGLVGSLAVSSASAAGPKNFAVGGGEQVAASITKHFAFSAHQGPNGASGYAVFTQDDPTNVFGDFALQGHVACVSVSGRNASIGVAIEKGSGTAEGQQAILIVVTDNGNGGSGTPDSLTNSGYLTLNDVAVCPAPFDATTPITSGNINVN
jgi:hypothetical protein